jgi:RimJ/RimL family protein N-acetyltransferase
LNFRRVEKEDVDLLFTWINEKETRFQSHSQAEVSYADHSRWFESKLTDKNCYLYIAISENVSVGMIRFDIKDSTCTISYLVDHAERGKGLGNRLIEEGTEKFLKESCFKGTLIALVKPANTASLKVFSNNHFQKEIMDSNTIRFKKSI